MGLDEQQLAKAQAYNAKIAGLRWAPADLPDDALRAAAPGSPEFALRVAALQAEEELRADGMLGPRTLQALIERRIEAEVAKKEESANLGFWVPGEDWPEAAAIANVSPPLDRESLDAYIDRMGCPHFSAFELTRLARWAVNVEPVREDWPNIVPTLRLAEILRHELGGDPLLVLSGYRPRRYNKAIGGAKGSLHPHFRSVQLGLDAENAASDADQRRLYEVAARLFAFYGKELKVGLGFYAPKRGTQITIDTGLGARSWQADYVKAVVADLGLTMPNAPAPAPAAPAAPAPSAPPAGGVPHAVFEAARGAKLGGLVSIEGAMGSRYYKFDKGVVHYNAVEHKVVEVIPGAPPA